MALPDRASLAARIAPVGGAVREAMRQATLRADDRLAELLSAATGGALVAALPAAAGRDAPSASDAVAGDPGPDVQPVPDAATLVGEPGPGRVAARILAGRLGDGDGVTGIAGAPTGGANRIGMVRRARAAKALLVAGRAAVTNACNRYRDGGRLTDDEMAWLTVLIATHLPVRDLAWDRTGDEPWHVMLWTDVLQRVEPDLAAGPASLLAFAAWRNGEGALASVAVRRALDVAPDYALAHLMDEVLDQCLAPSTWKKRPSKAKAKRRSRRRRRAS